MPKALSIAWSQHVSEQESALVLDTIERLLQGLYLRYWEAAQREPIRVRAYGYWAIPALVPASPYWGLQWYVNSSYDAGLEQVIAPRYLELVEKEPWQKANPHWDLAVLEHDLTEFAAPLARLRPGAYALGTSYPGQAAVISVYRLRRLAEHTMQELALRRLVLHHLGHLLGAPGYARQEQTVRRGLEQHCPNLCVMRHATTLEQLTSYSLQEAEMGWVFCEACTHDLVSTLIRHSHTWN